MLAFIIIEFVLISGILLLSGFLFYMDRRQKNIDIEKLDKLIKRLEEQKRWSKQYEGLVVGEIVSPH